MDYLLQQHPFLSFSIVFGVVAAAFAFLIVDLRRRWNAVFGKKVKIGSEALEEVLQRLLAAERELDAFGPRLEALETVARISIQKVGFKRFNPFDNTGGDQSFAICLLDQKNDGIVISSLYTREGVRVYAKAVSSGSSKHPLSDEEEEVLKQALKTES